MANSTKLQHVLRYGLIMRESFNFKKYGVAHWFPGHMAKGINQVQKRLKNVDCVIEVHDARIPVSGRNPLFERDISQVKPHILVLNKADLITQNETQEITQYYREQGKKNFIFTNCKNPASRGIKKLLPLVSNIIKDSERYARSTYKDYCVMILGIPNVGKSSLINALRAQNLHKGKATSVGALPGITKSVLERIKISEDPLIYVRDTPGILTPNIKTAEIGLKLALVNTIKDHLVGEDIICDFLLYRLNYEGNHMYVDVLDLDEPTDDVQKLLAFYAVKNNMTLRVRNLAEGGFSIIPNILLASKKFLHAYRSGKFGSLRLDL